MDAYVLGSHAGDLPTHLLREGEDGNRVRSMARLEGPDHDVFYAFDVADEESFELQVAKITALGSLVHRRLIPCIGPNCQGLLTLKRFSIFGSSHMPPGLVYELHWLEQENTHNEIDALVEILGPEGFAASTDGKGSFLIEIGSNDSDKLSQAASALSGVSRHAVNGNFLY